MSPEQLEMLAPLIVFAIAAFVVSIPVIAFSARFAIRPVVDALIRLREAQAKSGTSSEMMAMQDRRLALLESEMQHVSASLDRLLEAQEFQARLAAPQAQPSLPAPAAKEEVPAF